MRVIASVAAALVLGTGSAAIADVAGDRVEQARQRVLTGEFQAELPRYGSEAGADADGARAGRGSPFGRQRDPRMRRRVDGRDAAADTRDTRARAPETGPLGNLVSLLMWGIVIVLAAVLVFWLVTELWKRDDNPELAVDDARAATDEQTAAIIDRPLGDADELAQRGEYAEAIHTLLLRTLQELARSAAVRVERSQTSREILARVPLLAEARDALAGLITAVELTHFGDEPANAADYERCRQQFHRFATAFRATGMATTAAAASRTARAVPA